MGHRLDLFLYIVGSVRRPVVHLCVVVLVVMLFLLYFVHSWWMFYWLLIYVVYPHFQKNI